MILDRIRRLVGGSRHNREVEIVRKLMEEIFTLVFSTLAWADVDGISLSEATKRLEKAVCEKYGLGHEVILGLVAQEALDWLESCESKGSP